MEIDSKSFNPFWPFKTVVMRIFQIQTVPLATDIYHRFALLKIWGLTLFWFRQILIWVHLKCKCAISAHKKQQIILQLKFLFIQQRNERKSRTDWDDGNACKLVFMRLCAKRGEGLRAAQIGVTCQGWISNGLGSPTNDIQMEYTFTPPYPYSDTISERKHSDYISNFLWK